MKAVQTPGSFLRPERVGTSIERYPLELEAQWLDQSNRMIKQSLTIALLWLVGLFASQALSLSVGVSIPGVAGTPREVAAADRQGSRSLNVREGVDFPPTERYGIQSRMVSEESHNFHVGRLLGVIGEPAHDVFLAPHAMTYGTDVDGSTQGRIFEQVEDQPQFPSTETGDRTIAENTASGVDIGAPVAASNPGGETLTYSISGEDAASFSVVASTGQLRTSDSLNHETQSVYSFTMSVQDGEDGDGNPDNAEDDMITVTITVSNADETGSLSLRPAQPLVGTAYETVFSDPDGIAGQAVWTWERSSDQNTWTSITDFGTDRLSNNSMRPTPVGPIYLPTDADQGMYLRVTASYTDGEGSGKSLNALSEHVVGQRASSPPLTVVTFVTGLTVPWDLDFTPDGTMLFTERQGVLKARLTDGTVQEIAADFDDLFVHGHTGLLAARPRIN